MKINNKTELQHIAIDHSADIAIKWRFTENLQVKYIFFGYWYNITSLWSFKILKKKFNTLIKMTLTEQLKIFGNKIKENQAQYDLD